MNSSVFEARSSQISGTLITLQADGSVVGWIDLSGLVSKQGFHDHEAVLNGIAYDSMGDRLSVAGKLWPKLFEIEIVPKL